jgi:hypothetical protein
MMMWETCRVIRGAFGTSTYGRPAETVWSDVAALVVCRTDFAFKWSTRPDVVPEEYLGRSQGLLFTFAGVGIKERDIVIIVNNPELADKQFDVLWSDPVSDAGGVHHIEHVIAERDNLVVITP